MNKILGINNGNYIDPLLSKKSFHFKFSKLSTTDNILNGKPSDILYTGIISLTRIYHLVLYWYYILNKDISFGDIVYFEPRVIQYKKLVNGVIDQLKVSLVDGDGNEILSNFKISIVLNIVQFFLRVYVYIMELGDKLNPHRSYRKGFALKGIRQHITKTNNPSTIGPDELLTGRFPDLKENPVIVPGTTKLTFNISQAGTDANRTLVKNLGRNIIRKLVVSLKGNEIISTDDYDILYSCWKCTTERHNAVFQGIVEADGQTENAIKHRINAGDKASNASDETVASIFDNKFCIPLDFEILESSLPLYQYGLGSRFTYKLTFADYSNVIKASNPDATYTISNTSLEFDTVINASSASQIRTEYMKCIILYDRTLRSHIIPLNDSSTSFSVDINSPSRSLKSVLLIFTKERSATKFNRDTEEFFNPNITKAEVTVEGVPNELYAQNMEYRHQYNEITKHFGGGRLKEAGAIQKDLQLHNVNIASYYTDKYALWLDFRTIDDNRLHGSGRRLENTSEGIRLQVAKKAGSAGKLSCYLYIFQDAQINISDAQFLNVVY